MKLIIAIAITLLIVGLALTKKEFSPPQEIGQEQEPARFLLSPIDLQRQINTVLIRYQMDTITEDGKIGQRTAQAYQEAYSLQQAEISQRGAYE